MSLIGQHFDGRNDDDGKEYCVYMHVNLINGKCYIGLTKHTVGRWQPCHYKRCTHFYNAIKKYGWENFSHEVLVPYLTLEEAAWYEQAFIEEYGANIPEYGYNLTSGGEGAPSHTPWNKGKKMADLIEGYVHPMQGKHHTEESKAKMGEHHGPPDIEKMQEGYRRYIAEKGHPFKGKHHSAESNKANRDNHPKISVRQYSLDGHYIKTFECMTDAVREMGVTGTGLRMCLLGKHKQAHGFQWRADEGPYDDVPPAEAHRNTLKALGGKL